MRVNLTADEADVTMMALEYFRRFHLGEYDEESREQIARDVRTAERKVRDAAQSA